MANENSSIIERLEAALSYVSMFFAALMYVLNGRKSDFVAYHSIQAMAFNIAVWIIELPLALYLYPEFWQLDKQSIMFYSILVSIPIIAIPVVKSLQGDKFRIPVVSIFSDKYLAYLKKLESQSKKATSI